MTPELAAAMAATDQAWRHVRDVHGVDRICGSATWAEIHHQRAHRREGTPWHDAWTLEHDPDHHRHPSPIIDRQAHP